MLQCVVLRDLEALDEEGQAKSRGIGFVEFEEHEHALACLRQLNNNPNVISAIKRPIVEFAIENVKILKLRERKLRHQQEKCRKRSLAESAHRLSCLSGFLCTSRIDAHSWLFESLVLSPYVSCPLHVIIALNEQMHEQKCDRCADGK
jgi:RNA recognition motif-containing protein